MSIYLSPRIQGILEVLPNAKFGTGVLVLAQVVQNGRQCIEVLALWYHPAVLMRDLISKTYEFETPDEL